MRRSLRRRARRARVISLLPFLPLLFLLLSAAGSAQTIRRGPSERAHRVHHPDLSDSGSVDVSSGDWSQLGRLKRYMQDAYCCSDFGGSVAHFRGHGRWRRQGSPGSPQGLSFLLSRTAAGKICFPARGSTLRLGGPYFWTSSVAIDGDTIVAGTGASVVYVYVKPEGGWTDMYPTAILTYWGLGYDIRVVGIDQWGHDRRREIWVTTLTPVSFTYLSNQRPAGKTWHPTATLTASDGQPNDDFGAAVSINGKTIAVGATRYSAPGKAYVFVKPPAGWSNMTQTAELRASDATKGSDVGYSISTSNDRILVGSRGGFNQLPPTCSSSQKAVGSI